MRKVRVKGSNVLAESESHTFDKKGERETQVVTTGRVKLACAGTLNMMYLLVLVLMTCWYWY